MRKVVWLQETTWKLRCFDTLIKNKRKNYKKNKNDLEWNDYLSLYFTDRYDYRMMFINDSSNFP